MLSNRTTDDKVFDIVNVVVISLFMLVIIYPLWYIICASFSSIHAILQTPFVYKPVGFTLDNYKKVLDNSLIWRSFFNSIVYMLVGTAINVVMTMVTAFPLSRKSLPGRVWISKLVVVSMYVSGGMIPLYIVVDRLKLTNTIWSLVLPNAVSAYFVIIAISFMRSTIPESIQEAAIIDGCSYPRMFAAIIVPLSLPLIGVLVLQYGLVHWNSYTQAMIYLSDRNMFPLQLILKEILTVLNSQSMSQMINANVDYEMQVSIKEGVKYVSMVVSSVPLLIIYPFLKNFFISGLTLGGVKE